MSRNINWSEFVKFVEKLKEKRKKEKLEKKIFNHLHVFFYLLIIKKLFSYSKRKEINIFQCNTFQTKMT